MKAIEESFLEVMLVFQHFAKQNLAFFYSFELVPGFRNDCEAKSKRLLGLV